MEKKMSKRLSAASRTAALFLALAVLAAAGSVPTAAEEVAKEDEVLQYDRIANKIKPDSSTLSIDLPFAFDDPFTDEAVPDDMKNWFKSVKRCQADREKLTVVLSYVQFSQDYVRSYVTGNEEEASRLYLQGSFVDRMTALDEQGQIDDFAQRIMDIKLTGSKDTALLLKGSYREVTRNYKVWALQILHKKEIWQLVFFFDPSDPAMEDAVEAACFSAAVK